MLRKLVSILAFIASVAARLAVDTSTSTTLKSFQCAKAQNYTLAAIQCYGAAADLFGIGRIDSNCLQNYASAKSAGLTVDLVMFPCTGDISCKAPFTQVHEMVDFVRRNSMKINRVWIQVVAKGNPTNYPLTLYNRAVLDQFRVWLNYFGFNWGVYSARAQWISITGSATWDLASSRPLWYAKHDNYANFDDYAKVSFGGWTKPTMKQYKAPTKICDASFGKNYFN